MLIAIKLQIEQSALRQKINDLLGKDGELTTEDRAELGTHTERMQESEVELRAALAASGESEARVRAAFEAETTSSITPEERERQALRGKASISAMLNGALSGHAGGGAEAEMRSFTGAAANEIPLEMWEPSEHRADATTPAPGTVGVNLDPVMPAVFAGAVLPRLGVSMPIVASGTYGVPVISTSGAAAAKAKLAAIESSAAALTVSSMTPKRISARLSIALEDVAAIGSGNFEEALRSNIAMALSAELDEQGLNGDAQAPNLSGLFKALTDPAAAAAVVTYASFYASLGAEIDGLWATEMADLVLAINPVTMGKFTSVFQAATNYAGEVSIAAAAKRDLGGVFTNSRMPASSNAHVASALVYKSGKMGSMRTAVCPTWANLSIDDVYSDSVAGIRHFTIHALIGDVKVLYPAAYSELSFKTA